MEPWQAALLALVQGLTEFLPISSSAHLVIPGLVFGWPDQGLAFDVAVHVGTLAAVLFYFRRDLAELAVGTGSALVQRRLTVPAREVLALALGTLPVVLAGFLAGDFVEARLRNLPVIASTTLLFGLLLVAAHRASRRAGGTTVTLVAAVAIGLAQVLALVPGTSRSGITMTAAMLLGVGRTAAARFSFLLSIPVIAGAGLLKVAQLASAPAAVPWLPLALAALLAGLCAYSCIALFLRWVDRIGLLPFAAYRVCLSLVLYALWLA
ncbi:undecaprenyl-diphosphate phosphatase [Pseudohaliea rubra]|uniref:undecaprenyl-diphosphate phosphatase n=1 Tax=Pseudohaliea rubra TaxID=475795 RepID=UPI00054CE008|nr:undecaprenyl-diphosphate phosphatase [Pseudohaliea rubra]